MERLPKKDIFKTPEGYFEELADKVLEKRQSKQRHLVLSRWAAAAILVVGLTLFIFKGSIFMQPTENVYALDQEVEVLIDQGEWFADDVLSLSEDPNGILDDIIDDGWGDYELNEAELEQELWSY
ncbi:hypothetical protein GCM10028791_19380 [Echinicola sediminis]